MQDVTIKHILKKTNELNYKYNRDAIPPIQLTRIMEAEKLSFGRKDFSGSKIAELDRKARTIYLTKNEELMRKWGHFAIAHELGHWFLDKKEYDFFDPSTVTDPNCDELDKKANEFAALLLLPNNLIKEWNWLDEKLFASAFRVPQEVIELRNKIKLD